MVADTTRAIAPRAWACLVRDKFAPAWWTLVDLAGNDADIATTHRD